MNKIFISSVSSLFLAALFLTANQAEAQTKKRVAKKTTVTQKSKVPTKAKVSTKSTTNNKQPTTEEATTLPPVNINRTVQSLLTRIETNTGIYRRELNRSLIQNKFNGTDMESAINAYVSDFENAERMLKARVESGTDTAADAQDVLNRADFIQSFMRENTLSPVVQSQWKLLRDNLVTLASSYNVSWNINTVPNQTSESNSANNQPAVRNNQPNYPQQNNSTDRQRRNTNSANSPRFDRMLTGTYRLNMTQSDQVGEVLDRALGTNNQNNNQTTDVQMDRMRRNLERRLSAPDMLVIEKINDEVTLASNLSPEASFTADSVERTEVNPNGRTVRVKAAALSNVMEISYQGDRVNDFFMTFLPVDNGQLRVTRRLYIENRDQTITVTSVYDKILPTADFSVVRNNQNLADTRTNPNYPNNPNSTITPGISNDFIVPNGTQMIAVLNSLVSTQNVREGDRFTMEISQPSQLAGAVIEGFVSNTQQATRVSNNAQVTFNFDKITMPDSRAYRFNGMIDAIQLPTGEAIRVLNQNNTGASTRQAQRAGIGGALGAIFGAIVTGNAGQNQPADNVNYGSGSIVLQGQTNIDLQSGTQFRIISTSRANPANGN